MLLTADEYIKRMSAGVKWPGKWSVQWVSPKSLHAILKLSGGEALTATGEETQRLPVSRILVNLRVNADEVRTPLHYHYRAINVHTGRLLVSELDTWKTHVELLEK